MTNVSEMIGVGIVGLSADGGWASLAHVPALRAMPERFAIKALSASSAVSAAAAGIAHEVPYATSDPALLAARDDVDLVVVTVKVPHHRELVAHALANGKSVYCEWPLGRDLVEADAMTASAVERGVQTFVGLQARSAPALRYLRDLVADGYVGTILSTSVVGAGGFPWGGAATTGTAYVLDGATGATMLSIPFGHMIDAFTWVLGGFDHLNATLALKYPDVALIDGDRSVTATAPDHVAVSGTLANGAIASLFYHGGDSPTAGFRWEIRGTAGTVLVEGDSGHLQYGHIRLSGRQVDAPLADLPVPDAYRRVDTNAAGYGDAVAHAYRAVHDDLTKGMKSVPSFADAVETHRLLDRIELAAEWSRERK